MADEIKNGISFDRDYWPKGGTTIPIVVAADFSDLWEKHEEQLSTLIAEALIADPPFISFEVDDVARIEIFLWEIGGDTLCQRVALAEMLDNYTDVFAGLLSEDEIDPALKALDDVQAAIDRLRVSLRNLKLECEA